MKKWLKRSLSAGLLLAVAVLAASLWVFQDRTLPPDGPLGVGRRELVVQVPGDPVFGSVPRRIPASIWYPTPGPAGQVSPDAAPAPELGPLVVFAHGNLAVRDGNVSLFRALASRGYVVLAADHVGVSMVASFPDGSMAWADPSWRGLLQTEDLVDTAASELFVQVGDLLQRDLLALVEAAPSALPGLDTSRVVFGGHSLGGAISVHLCATEPRCAAVIDLDGPPLFDLGTDDAGAPALNPPTLAVPLLLITSEHLAEQPAARPALEAWPVLLERATAPSTAWTVRDSGHLDLGDLPLVVRPVVARSLFGGKASVGHGDTARQVGATNAAVIGFLDEHLRAAATFDPHEWTELRPLEPAR